MSDFTADLRDIRFNLYEQLGATMVNASPRYADWDREVFDMTLDEAYKFAREVLAPLNGPSDKEGCHFADNKVVMPKGLPA